MVEAALDSLLAADANELDASDSEEAIAAAEIVARARRHGNFHATGSQQVNAWIARLGPSPAALRCKAREAIRRILDEPSELSGHRAGSEYSRAGAHHSISY